MKKNEKMKIKKLPLSKLTIVTRLHGDKLNFLGLMGFGIIAISR